MTKSIDGQVADNTERIRDVDSRFVAVDTSRRRGLTFGPNLAEIAVDVDVYKRDTENSVQFSLNNFTHGLSRGTFGDDRRSWSNLGADVDVTLTTTGANRIAKSFAGGIGAIRRVDAGVDSTTPAKSDSDVSGTFASAVSTNTPTGDTTTVRAVYDAAEFAGDPVEFGIFDTTGDVLMFRAVVDPSSFAFVGSDDDVRVDFGITVTSASTSGTAVITDAVKSAVAESIASVYSAVGPDVIRFGKGNKEFDPSDTSLGDPVIGKTVLLTQNANTVRVETSVTQSEPSTQPVDLTELSVEDGSGTTLYLASFDSFEKTDDESFDASVSFRFV